jgi:hypothetical protein
VEQVLTAATGIVAILGGGCAALLEAPAVRLPADAEDVPRWCVSSAVRRLAAGFMVAAEAHATVRARVTTVVRTGRMFICANISDNT